MRLDNLVVVRVDARELLAAAARDPQRVVVEQNGRRAARDVDLGDRLVGLRIDPRHDAFAIGDNPDAAEAGGDAAAASATSIAAFAVTLQIGRVDARPPCGRRTMAPRRS